MEKIKERVKNIVKEKIGQLPNRFFNIKSFGRVLRRSQQGRLEELKVTLSEFTKEEIRNIKKSGILKRRIDGYRTRKLDKARIPKYRCIPTNKDKQEYFISYEFFYSILDELNIIYSNRTEVKASNKENSINYESNQLLVNKTPKYIGSHDKQNTLIAQEQSYRSPQYFNKLDLDELNTQADIILTIDGEERKINKMDLLSGYVFRYEVGQYKQIKVEYIDKLTGELIVLLEKGEEVEEIISYQADEGWVTIDRARLKTLIRNRKSIEDYLTYKIITNGVEKLFKEDYTSERFNIGLKRS